MLFTEVTLFLSVVEKGTDFAFGQKPEIAVLSPICWFYDSIIHESKWAQYSYIALLSYKKNIYIYTVYKDKSGVEVCFILKYLLKQKWWIQDLKKHYKI